MVCRANDLAAICAVLIQAISLRFQRLTSLMFDEPSFTLTYDVTGAEINIDHFQNL